MKKSNKLRPLDLSKELPAELLLDYSRMLPNRFADRSAVKNNQTKKKASKKAKRPKSNRASELPVEVDFDFSKARPNRFVKQLRGKELVVVVESDLAKAFPDARSVNEAPRKQLAAKTKPKSRKATS